MNQGFNVLQRVFLGRRSGQAVIALVGPFRHIVQALADDAQALPYLLYPHHRPVVAVALVADGHLELELVVAAVRAIAAQVEVHPRRPQRGAGDTPFQRLPGAVAADVHGALLEDAVIHGHHLVVIQARRHAVDEFPHQPIPAARQVLGDTADAEPGRVHASAGNGLDDAEQAFAVGEHVKYR